MNKYTYVPPCSKEQLLGLYFDKNFSQLECAVILNVSQKIIFTAMKHFKIKARVAAKRDQVGEKNDSWKGDRAGKHAFHRRLYSKYGKPYRCAICGTKDKLRSYDYANLTGNYHNIKDYKSMCRSCHWKYDDKILNIKHMKKRRGINESS